MYKKILIIGAGSAGQNHLKALKALNKNFKIKIISSRKLNFFNNKNLIKSFVPDYIILSCPAKQHFRYIMNIEKNFISKKILIEKPLFEKPYRIQKNLKNHYFVGYNLRFHPIIQYLKKNLKNKKIYFASIICSSYLPHWRKKKNYMKSVSAQKKLGGGALLELSHELDYIDHIFGENSLTYSYNKKLSDLKINVDDFLCLNAISSKKVFINLLINFFSRINRREIHIEGKNLSLQADLILNKILIIRNGKKKILKWRKFKNINTYQQEHLDIISGNLKHVCNITEANKTLKIIKQIQDLR